MIDLKDIMVHRSPMLLLNELLECGEDYAIGLVTIRSNSLFIEEQGLPSWVGIELMAQTIAAMAGMRGKQKNETPQIGFLLGSRQYHAPMTHFPLGETLRIHVQESFVGDDLLGQYDCRIDSSLGVIEAKLNVYQPDEPHSILTKDSI